MSGLALLVGKKGCPGMDETQPKSVVKSAHFVSSQAHQSWRVEELEGLRL